MPNIYNDILWQTLLGENEVEICLQPTELPTDIYQPTNSTLNTGMYSFLGETLLYELVSHLFFTLKLINAALYKIVLTIF